MRKDDFTAELPGVPKRPGRPASGKAKSGADRQREYRQRLKEAGAERSAGEVLTVQVSGEVLDALRDLQRRCRQDGAEYSLAGLAEGGIRAYLVKCGYSFSKNLPGKC